MGKRCGIMLAIALTVTAVPAAAAKYEISTAAEQRTYGVHNGHTIAKDFIIVKRGDNHPPYLIVYQRCTDPAHAAGTDVGDGDTGLGFDIPGGYGWYLNDALEVLADGKSVTRAVAAEYKVVETGNGVLAMFVWEAPQMTVTAIFGVRDGRDGVYTSLSCRPKKQLGAISVLLRCYPALPTSACRESGERWVLTSSGREGTVKCFMQGNEWREEPARTMKLEFPGDAWILYGDKILDAGKAERSEGPSALAVVPDKITGGAVTVTGYEIRTVLDLPPEGATVRMAFFELKKVSNREAVDFLRENGSRIVAALSAEDLDLDRRFRADIEAVLVNIRKGLAGVDEKNLKESERQTLAGLRKELDQLAAALAEKQTPGLKGQRIFRKTADDLDRRVADFSYRTVLQ